MGRKVGRKVSAVWMVCLGKTGRECDEVVEVAFSPSMHLECSLRPLYSNSTLAVEKVGRRVRMRQG